MARLDGSLHSIEDDFVTVHTDVQAAVVESIVGPWLTEAPCGN
jgi:hypothetical protein